jgi:SM-20-related protein
LPGIASAPTFLEKNFNELIESFIENKVGITDNFLGAVLASNLKANLTSYYQEKLLLSAGTGNKTLVTQDTLFRSDKICWLDRSHNNIYENKFFDLMDRFIAYLNDTCYTGITGCEFHYTLYEEGSFYKKHIDQFRNDESRKYSMVMYLNEGWTSSDGGELRIYHSNDRQQNISPDSGKSVFFKSSELEHEVLVTNKPRMSITGWLK